jgi:hypothetical protein
VRIGEGAEWSREHTSSPTPGGTRADLGLGSMDAGPRRRSPASHQGGKIAEELDTKKERLREEATERRALMTGRGRSLDSWVFIPPCHGIWAAHRWAAHRTGSCGFRLEH